MDEQFIITRLELLPQDHSPKRQLARFTFRHIQVRDGHPDKTMHIDPIETSVTQKEAIEAKEVVYSTNVFGTPGLMLTLHESDEHRRYTTLESQDGKLILIVPPQKLHR